MAPRRKGKQAAKPDAPEDVVPVIDALAARLAQLGRRKWKVGACGFASAFAGHGQRGGCS